MSQPSAGVQGLPHMPAPVQRLNQLLLGQFIARSVGLAAELGIADLLRDGALSLTELAERTRSNPDALYRVLRALAAVEVFEERPGKHFANSELSTFLRTDVDGSLAAMARWLVDASGWAAWGRLDHSVRTGKPAFDEVLGSDCFACLERHPASLEVFQAAMTSYSALTSSAVLDAYDFSGVGVLLDVGGGHGSLLSKILDRTPSLSGILFDRAEVVAGASEHVRRHGQRLRVESGNFLERVPSGADAILLKHVLHDWDDAKCATLLGLCRRSLPEGGRLLVVESILTDRPEATFGKFLDLEMLVVTPGGRERTRDELSQLLSAAHFELGRVLPTRSPVSILEATAR